MLRDDVTCKKRRKLEQNMVHSNGVKDIGPGLEICWMFSKKIKTEYYYGLCTF